MKRRMAFLLLVLFTSCLCMSTTTICLAAEKVSIPTVMNDVYIYDDENIIENDTESQLNKMLVQLEEQTEIEFAVISIGSLQNQTIEEYAYTLFNSLHIGKADKDNGILLLISQSDTKVRLEIGRGLEGCLNDAKCGRILDNYFVPYREENEYTEATKLTVQAVINALASEYDFEISDLNTEISVSEEDEIELSEFIWLLIIIIIAGIVLGLLSSGDSGGSYSGGHSSSYSGGSSFGGFGGGSTGGGGASR